MKLEQQVVSLELAKKLKELGFKQESLFWWCEQLDYGVEAHITQERTKNDYSAYTVAELGEMLPENVCWRNYTNQERIGGRWSLAFGDFTAFGNTEADCKAKMLIYLKENNLI